MSQHPSGAHTHGPSGPDPLIVAAVIIAIAIAGPAGAAVYSLATAIIIAAIAFGGVVLIGGTAFIIWRIRSERAAITPLPEITRTAEPRPAPRQADRPAITAGQPVIHVHLHNADAAEALAAALRHHGTRRQITPRRNP
ncbi:MAG: hypothetical protein M0030_30605 [Actinomycetota bacterium]|nr:hypothetical protein [Actinomycetota bacterium]